jgi:A/G-specific adenine glycosylase
MASAKKKLSRNRGTTRTVRNADDGRMFPPLPEERAGARADVNKTKTIPHSAFHTPHSTQLVPALLSWFATNARDLPWRRARDPYAIWVSEIMLQQTQVKTVIPYWERWLRELPTIETLAKASPAKIHKLWEGLGYYTRVRNMQKAAQQIIAEHGGKFPPTFDAILALPGIGRYTAGAICSITFNQPTPILDGNVIRVLTRVYGIATDPREKQTNAQLWLLANELVLCASRTAHHTSPCSHLNQSLMELGALICTPRSPNCTACPVQKFCIAQKENLQDQLPNLGKRVTTTDRRFIAFVVEHDSKFLVRQRPAGVVNAHLWEFPNAETGARGRAPQHSAAKELGFRIAAPKPLRTIKHSITRYRITLEVWLAELTAQTAKISGHWLTAKRLHHLAFTSAHKKILQAITEAKTHKRKKLSLDGLHLGL